MERIIDLSDRTQYPASVLANLNCGFALGDDNDNFLWFLQGKWQKPKYDWGWDVITHEEAVKSDFLFRAFCSMNKQYRERRDAAIAAEGCLFDDIDWDRVGQLEHNADAYRLRASYYFGIENYKDGLARVCWMLYPDGSYFADADGFGMEDNEEVNVYAYIDTECRVVVKFQDKEHVEEAKARYLEAQKDGETGGK